MLLTLILILNPLHHVHDVLEVTNVELVTQIRAFLQRNQTSNPQCQCYQAQT